MAAGAFLLATLEASGWLAYRYILRLRASYGWPSNQERERFYDDEPMVRDIPPTPSSAGPDESPIILEINWHSRRIFRRND
jgi:hypothetical protein